MEYLGINIDKEKNKNAKRGTPVDITAEGSKVAVWAIPTNEEYMIAIDTQRLANK
jgi:acetate kinase